MFSLVTGAMWVVLKCIFSIIFCFLFLVFIFLVVVITGNKKRIERLLLKPKKLPLLVDFIRWAIIDILRGKEYPIWGIYVFVAKPGNGKTISMTEHIERVKKEHPTIKVYSNFNIKGQTGTIKTWKDIVEADDNSIIAIDEVHTLFSSLNFQDFPMEILAEITQNRKSRKQFITSTQDYDLINVNFKRVCNYVVYCKNFWGMDRLFTNYYFDRGAYESRTFECDKKKADFVRMFIANDSTYKRYDTLERISSAVNEFENKDINAVVKTLKELKNSTELQPKEVRYINNMIERILSDLHVKEVWDSKEKEIQLLKDELELLKESSIAV